MAASFPGAVKNFNTVVNGVTKLVASLFNLPYDEITAIETALGANLTNICHQVVNTQTGAYASGSTQIPYDDTIPQKTEGDEYMTLAITPTAATTKLKIDVVACITDAGGDNRPIVALFKDDDADAIAAVIGAYSAATTSGQPINFTHYMTSGTTDEITFKVRAGCQGHTLYFNGISGARKLGGVSASSITITECPA